VGRTLLVVLVAATGCTDVLGFEDVTVDDLCLQDSFDDGTLDPGIWSPFGSVVERDGRLHIALPSASISSQGIVTTVPHDLEGGALEVDIAKSVNQVGNARDLIAVVADQERYLLIDAEGGRLAFAGQGPAGTTNVDIAFDPRIAHWRIRHDTTDNSIHFETAIETSWTTRLIVAAPFSLTDVYVQFEADSFDPAPVDPGVAELDGVRVSGPNCAPR